jgi:iron complex outermembrane receptor protein
MGSIALVVLALPLTGAESSVEQLKRLSIDELMQVEVTSVSRSPVALGEVPSALQLITAEEIRRSGASSLAESLRLADNLSTARKNTHDWGIAARGFNAELANKLLVMIDGRTVYTPLFSGVRWDVQDYLMEDVERIEVISGPGGSVWGANAVNGVINITTKSARETQGWYAEGGGGNQLRDFEAARYGGTLAPNVFFRVYGKHFERDSEILVSGLDAKDGTSFVQGGFRLDAESTARGNFTLQGDYYHGREGVVDAGPGHVAGGNLLSRWTKTLANDSDVRIQFYYDRTFLRLPVPASFLAPAGLFEDDLETYDLDFQHSFHWASAHALVWGLGCRLTEDETKAAPGLGFEPPKLNQSLFSGFIQDQIAINERTHLTFGAKLEHTDYTGFEIEPSIRLQRDVDAGLTVWGAISRAVRTPSRVDRDIHQPSTGIQLLAGGPNFRSESVIAYELGVRGQLASKVAGSVSAFYNDYHDVRSAEPSPVTFLPFVIANNLEGESYGVEFAFNADVMKGWRIRGGYRLLKSDLRVRPGAVDINGARNETADPEHQINLGSSVDLPGGVELDGQLRWVDELVVNNGGQLGTVPSYLDLTLRVGFRVSESVEFSVVGMNLLDDHHTEIGSPGPSRVEIRRSVFGKLTWRY